MKKIFKQIFVLSILSLVFLMPFVLALTPTECSAGSICKRINHVGETENSENNLEVNENGNQVCYNIKNNHPTNDYFIPMNSIPEFNAFVNYANNNPDAKISISGCAECIGKASGTSCTITEPNPNYNSVDCQYSGEPQFCDTSISTPGTCDGKGTCAVVPASNCYGVASSGCDLDRSKSCCAGYSCYTAANSGSSYPSIGICLPTTDFSKCTLCSAEGGTCNFNGVGTISYGAGTSFNVLTITHTTPCTNAVFGDPIFGTVKNCFIGDCRGSSATIIIGADGKEKVQVSPPTGSPVTYTFGDCPAGYTGSGGLCRGTNDASITTTPPINLRAGSGPVIPDTTILPPATAGPTTGTGAGPGLVQGYTDPLALDENGYSTVASSSTSAIATATSTTPPTSTGPSLQLCTTCTPPTSTSTNENVAAVVGGVTYSVPVPPAPAPVTGGGSSGGSSGGSGNKVICTEAHRLGYISDSFYAADQKYAATVADDATMAGYHSWAKPLVRAMQKDYILSMEVIPIAVAWSEHSAYMEGITPRDNEVGRIILTTAIPLCKELGNKMMKENLGNYQFNEKFVADLTRKYMKPNAKDIDVQSFFDELEKEFSKQVNNL